MEWPVWQDSRQFNNGSTSDLRKRFQAWLTSDEPYTEFKVVDTDRPSTSRNSRKYEWSIQVDEETMESALKCDNGGGGRANDDVVEVNWREGMCDDFPAPDDYTEPKRIERDTQEAAEQHSGWPFVENSHSFNIGFQRVAFWRLCPDYWTTIVDTPRWPYYVRPNGIAGIDEAPKFD
ncbi:hypothetical protein BT63DRAFT_412981 [Microthyrium microscopicum]|uniref:Uncharacterized protein n=1 Tax=Microthyrium microscopicum TaxID=703497 RepID=A0A6A6UFH1_9PEZI|nr:hypothetical protein BT63DRAFT_412981 [Microthyrium microscopicum]